MLTPRLFDLCYERPAYDEDKDIINNLATITFHLGGADLMRQPPSAFSVGLDQRRKELLGNDILRAFPT